jgi:MoxR-like ATPase
VGEDRLEPRLEVDVEIEGGKPVHRRVSIDGDVVRVGSNAGNELVLADPTVSRMHCKLRATPTGWRVLDTGSLNGTRLDGVRIRDADLAMPECTLEVGESKLRLRAPAPAAHPGHATNLAPAMGALYGQSPIMLRVFARIAKLARADSDVLIEGQSGTGKELVAAEIVRRSSRASKPFIILDCAALSRSRVEVELFGAQPGSLPGVKEVIRGAFELARGGTVLLDEVVQLPIDVQPLLLRALAEREVRRLGSNTVIKFDARVIATTNCRIEDVINTGQFREDLYFRLGALRLEVPPLRERTEDLPLLVGAILEELGQTDKASLFTDEVYRDLAERSWPGNVRELRQFVERLVVTEEFDSPSATPLVAENGGPPTRRGPARGVLPQREGASRRGVRAALPQEPVRVVGRQREPRRSQGGPRSHVPAPAAPTARDPTRRGARLSRRVSEPLCSGRSIAVVARARSARPNGTSRRPPRGPRRRRVEPSGPTPSRAPGRAATATARP